MAGRFPGRGGGYQSPIPGRAGFHFPYGNDTPRTITELPLLYDGTGLRRSTSVFPHFMADDSYFQALMTGQDQYCQEQFYQGDWSQRFVEGEMYYHHDNSYYQQDHMYYQDNSYYGTEEQYYGRGELHQREQQDDQTGSHEQQNLGNEEEAHFLQDIGY